MQIPLTSREFFDVFREYNQGIWPAQWIALPLDYLYDRDAARRSTGDLEMALRHTDCLELLATGLMTRCT